MSEFSDADTIKFLSPFNIWATSLADIPLQPTETVIKGRKLYSLLTDTGSSKGPYKEWCKVTRLNEDTVGIELISTQVGMRWVFSCYTDSFNFDNHKIQKNQISSEFIFFELVGYDYDFIKRDGSAWLLDPTDEGSYSIDTFFDANVERAIYLGGPRSRRRGRGQVVVSYEESDDENDEQEKKTKQRKLMKDRSDDTDSDSDTGLSNLKRVKNPPTVKAPLSTVKSSPPRLTTAPARSQQPPVKNVKPVTTTTTPATVSAPYVKNTNVSPTLSTPPLSTKPRGHMTKIPSVRTRLSPPDISTNKDKLASTPAVVTPIIKAPPPFSRARSSIGNGPPVSRASTPPSAASSYSSSKKSEANTSLSLSTTATTPTKTESPKSAEIIAIKAELDLKDLIIKKLTLENTILKHESTTKPSEQSSPYNFESYNFTKAIAIAPKTYINCIQNKSSSKYSSIIQYQTTDESDQQLNYQMFLLSQSAEKPHPQFLKHLRTHIESTPFSTAFQLEFEPVSMSLREFHTRFIKSKKLNAELAFVLISQLISGLDHFYQLNGRLLGSISLDSIVLDSEMKNLKFTDLSKTLQLGQQISTRDLTIHYTILSHPVINREKSITVNNTLDLWELGKVLHFFLKDVEYNPNIIAGEQDQLFKLFLRDDFEALKNGVDLQSLIRSLQLENYIGREIKETIQM